MRSRQAKMLLAIILTALVSLGCAVLSRPTASVPAPAQDTIATAVAATLAVNNPIVENTPVPSTPTIQVSASPAATALPLDTPTSTLPPQPSELLGGVNLVVAYVDPSHNIWVWRSGSAPRQITSFGDVDSVKVSDDASLIAFSRTTDFIHYSLWVIRSDGSAGRPVMDLPEFEALPRAPEAVSVMPAAFGWKPRAHILAFSTRPTFEGPGLMMNNDLWLADIDAETRNEVLSPGEGGQFFFSPDGAYIALVQPDSISLVDADGSNRRDRVFDYPPVTTYSEYAFYASPVWAPDSSQLFVVIPPAAALEHPDDPAQVWRIPRGGSPAASLGSFSSALNLYPQLSPNLEKLAYLRQVGSPEQNRRELHLANPDGSDDFLYQEAAYLSFHAWAPGSRRFLYSVGETPHLMLGELGASPQPAGEQTGINQVRWVDDNRFLYALNSGANLELRLRTIAGEEIPLASFATTTSPFLSYDFGIAR
jgi:hypothetical protein